MATYVIIGLAKPDGNVALWTINATVRGNFLMIFRQWSYFTEAANYAARHGKGPDEQVAHISFTADSPAQAKAHVEELWRSSTGAVGVNFVIEGERSFEGLLAAIRKQNATNS